MKSRATGSGREVRKWRAGRDSLLTVSIVAVVLAGVMVLLSMAGARPPTHFVTVTTTPAPATTVPASPQPTTTTAQSDPLAIGSPNAPVTIVEYEDFR